MKKLINKINAIIEKKPSNAFLLFLTGFFFIQFMLVNILYIKHPLGGWVTSLGVFTTPFILMVILLALSLCLIALWKSVPKRERSNSSRVIKASIVKTRNSYSPIDYPKGSTTAVVSGYALG